MSLFRKKIVEEITFYDIDTLTANLNFYGLCGGDSGHGAYLNLKFKSIFSHQVNGSESNETELIFRGDAEIRNFIRVCAFVSEVLKEVPIENIDPCYDEAIQNFRLKNMGFK